MKLETEAGIDTLIIMAIAAFLGYMAFGSGWHSGLFGYLAFVAYSVGNRVVSEIRRIELTIDQSRAR